MNTAQPITDSKTLAELLDVYDKGSKNHLLLTFCLFTGLRITDALQANVQDSLAGHWIGKEQKTGKSKRVTLNPKLRLLIGEYVVKEGLKGDDFLFYSNKDKSKPISRVQAYRIVAHAGDMIGLKLSCHSLRKTFGYMAYKGGQDLSLVQEIFNHSSQAVTLRYIGITQEKIDKVYIDLPIDI